MMENGLYEKFNKEKMLAILSISSNMGYTPLLLTLLKNFSLSMMRDNIRKSQKVLLITFQLILDPLEFLPTTATGALALVNPVSWKIADTYPPPWLYLTKAFNLGNTKQFCQ